MNRRDKVSLGVSIIFHFIIFTGIPDFEIKDKPEIKSRELKIIPEERFQKIPKDYTNTLNKGGFNKPPSYVEEIAKKTIIKGDEGYLLKKQNMILSSKEIIFTEINRDREIKKTPGYAAYYRFIREKIKKNAYDNYNSSARGVIYISFIVAKDGSLNSLKLIQGTDSPRELADIALKSIEDAAPFPPFPAELNHPKLQFQVSIHFKNGT